MTTNYHCPQCEYPMERIYDDTGTTFVWCCECCGCTVAGEDTDDE